MNYKTSKFDVISQLFRIKEERFVYFAEEICKLFPSETRELYYIHRTVANDGFVMGASGALYEKYNNLRKELNILDMIVKAQSNITESQPSLFQKIFFMITNIIIDSKCFQK